MTERWLTLCAVGDMGEGDARSFLVGAGTERQDVILLREQGALRAYRNACPHQGTPLETFPDRFKDPATGLLVCSTHGARFRPEDGTCVSGPCRGKGLLALPVRASEGGIEVLLAGPAVSG